ncbi:MAG: sigma-70 family RNA polymerase sigma factor [Candidatus Acidiferrales bacterium]
MKAGTAEKPLTAREKEADEKLLVAAAQKNPARFAELYELYFARVYSYVARRVGDRDAAEDLTSEVFHSALANLPRFEWRGAPFGAWLFRIAANAIADRWKRNAKEQGSPAAEEFHEADYADAGRCATLFRFASELPADQKRVIELRFQEEKSIREIAQEIQRTEGAVKQLQFRALQTLRERMKESHG